MLDKQGLLAAGRRKTSSLEIDGGAVRLMELSGTGRDEYDHFVTIVAAGNWRNVRAKLAQLSIVDEAGELMFARDEVDKVGDISGNVLDKIFDECKRLNGLDEAIEELEKK
mgnify:CR=1 FL=1